MPIEPPPSDFRGHPVFRVLPAGTELWRVHRAESQPHDFRKESAHPYFGPGRFDAMPPDEFPFLYAAARDSTALAEVLLRDLSHDRNGDVLLPWAAVERRLLSQLVTTVDLRLVSLISATDLAAVSQDARLVNIDGHQQAWSRYWTQWLRRVARDAQGVVWQSNRDRPHESLMLFGDRCDQDALRPGPQRGFRLDTEAGVDWLNGLMRPYRVLIKAPSGVV